MTTATRRRSAALATLVLGGLLLPAPVRAIKLDDRGEMRLGLRGYTSVRVGTEKMGGSDNPLVFPDSAFGHVRQNRYFLELKLDHDITRIGTTGTGFAWLFGWMKPNHLKYSLQYRGEGEGIYDYGPSEFSDQGATTRRLRLQFPGPNGGTSPVPQGLIDERVAHLRNIGRQRHQLFTAYLDFEKGPLFLRVGRQILAWGETDVFRLLDNINPLDQGFGGFLIPLDERRVPIDMLRANYHFTSIGPLSDAVLEGFVGLGNKVATDPGIPAGSPWMPGGLGRPNTSVKTVVEVPDPSEIRGGAMFKFNYANATFTLAHYWTYLDTPGVVFRVPGATQKCIDNSPLGGAGCAVPGYGHEITAAQEVPRTPVTGASVTFPLESLYTIVRSEVAYFTNEPVNRQGRGNPVDALCGPNDRFCNDTPYSGGFQRLQSENNLVGGLNPFVYPGFADLFRKNAIQGSVLRLNTFNFALGFDVNRFVRWLNPHQTFFISTQVFYKHYFDSPGDLILPVPVFNKDVPSPYPLVGKANGPGCGSASDPKNCELVPRFIHVQDNAVLHTLLITTSYAGGRIVPSLGAFYDWAGAWVVQPGVQLIRDPFRFVFDYTFLKAGIGSGQLAALRDRDNVRFQVEYVF